jgi:hypothetical protein
MQQKKSRKLCQKQFLLVCAHLSLDDDDARKYVNIYMRILDKKMNLNGINLNGTMMMMMI